MIPAYLLLEARVSDPLRYSSYEKLAVAAVALHGGRYLVQNGHSEVLQGRWAKPEHLVVIEFDSAGAAKKFYNSAEYAAALAARADAAEINILLVDGLPS